MQNTELKHEAWKYFIQSDPFKPGYMIDCDAGMIRCPDYWSKAQVESVANLVCSAPELLAALQALLASYDKIMAGGQERPATNPVAKHARAAIAKAIGGAE